MALVEIKAERGVVHLWIVGVQVHEAGDQLLEVNDQDLQTAGLSPLVTNADRHHPEEHHHQKI